MKKVLIFDLDHTIIDSSHRQITFADGSLDLNNWIANCTKEKIFADSLLPLAEYWRAAQQNPDNEIIVCTARVMGEHDYEFLKMHSLNAVKILSRPMGCRDGDADLKENLLRKYAKETGRSWARFSKTAGMYDDNQAVLIRLESLNITCYDAIILNSLLTAA